MTAVPPVFHSHSQALPNASPSNDGLCSYAQDDGRLTMAQRLRQSDQALALLYHARAATPFFSQGGQPCASIPSSVDSCRVLPLRSADFRDWLTANYYSEFETAPSSLALRAALRTLEARAQYGDSPAQKVDPSRQLRRRSLRPIQNLPRPGQRGRRNPRNHLPRLDPHRQPAPLVPPLPGMLPLPSPANPQPPIPNPVLTLTTLFHLTPHGAHARPLLAHRRAPPHRPLPHPGPPWPRRQRQIRPGPRPPHLD